MRIGELLIMNGLLNEEQLNEALQEQTLRPVKLGEILTDKGFITERQLVEALEFQLGVPVAILEETECDISAVKLVSDTIARKHHLVPIECGGGKIKVAMADPASPEAIRDVQLETGLHVKPLIATRTQVEQALIRYYGVDESAEAFMEILENAVKRKATHIHLEPMENGMMVKYRVDQLLQPLRTFPKKLERMLVQRILSLAGVDRGGARLPRYGHFQIQAGETPLDIHASVMPTSAGDSIVLRLTDESENLLRLSELDLGEVHLQKLEKALDKRSGLILAAGVSGSGTTSTLYACLHQLDLQQLKIITLEDPVDRKINGITQVEIREQDGLTYPAALRSAMRQDPNVIMIGDIRDPETAELAARASLSHKLVLGAIHAGSAVQALGRLTDLGLDAYRIGSSLNCIVAQRLVRRICRQCAQSVPITDEEASLLEANGLLPTEEQKNPSKGLFGNFRSIVSAQMSGKLTLLRGTGCRLCHDTGYRGLVAVQEVLQMDEPLKKLILDKRPLTEIERHLEQTGFKPMLYDGLKKARDGLTTVDEIRNAIPMK